MATNESGKQSAYQCADCGKTVKAPENKPKPTC
jgi:DNA-directed RNA polymerase subunit RPC12/RpoP